MIEKLGYSPLATAKSVAGVSSPETLLAILHAKRVLFVDALSHHNERNINLCLSMSMVAQARQPSGWPVSSSAGTANLVWATTHEISSSGGSCFINYCEAILCLKYVLYLLLQLINWGKSMMFDNTPLTLEEVVDHCRALTHAIIEIQHPVYKELLLFILFERLEILNLTLEMEMQKE